MRLPLAACSGGEEPERQRPPVSYSAVEELRTEAALRFISTDDALAELESAVAALDSTGQEAAQPFVETLRGQRARLQARLDSLDAAAFPTRAAFDSLAAEVRQRLDGLDMAIARDRILIAPDAAALRTTASARLAAIEARAASMRADSTLASIRKAATLDSARVRLGRQLALLGARNVRFDSLRDVLAEGFGELRRLEPDTLALRLDSLR